MFTLPRTAGPAPAIETQRLRLRGHRFADFAASLELWNDPLVYRHITGKPARASEVWARLLRYAGHWALLGYGYWAIEEKASGRFVGEAGFADYRREIEPPMTGMPEIGWVLSPAVHGRGYGSEAVGAAIAWGDAHFGDRPTACICAPENGPSLRIAAKFGYREKCRTTYLGNPTVMLVREAINAKS